MSRTSLIDIAAEIRGETNKAWRQVIAHHTWNAAPYDDEAPDLHDRASLTTQ